MNENKCPICKKNANNLLRVYTGIDANQFECENCGVYIVTRLAWYELQGLKDNHRPLLSAYTRERTIRNLDVITLVTSDYKQSDDSFEITYIRISEAINLFPHKIFERLDRILMNLRLLSPFTGSFIEIDINKDAPLLFADSMVRQASLFMYNLLLKSGYIDQVDQIRADKSKILINEKGWSRINELESHPQKDSTQAFTAMWFGENMHNIFEKYISKAVEQAGFSPFIIPMKEHNDNITDHIIAEIRRSRFLIADFTGQRGGVYFEAGFAYGLGIPVIWTCREDWFKKEIEKRTIVKLDSGDEVDGIIKEKRETHFDIDHYNFILWKTGEELQEKLYQRIRATII